MPGSTRVTEYTALNWDWPWRIKNIKNPESVWQRRRESPILEDGAGGVMLAPVEFVEPHQH